MTNNSQEIIFNKERNFKEIFSDSLDFLKQHWKQYFLLIAIYAGPFYIAAAYYNSIAQIKIVESQDIFGAIEIAYSAFFKIIGEFLVNAISFGFILLTIQKKETSREAVATFLNDNIWNILAATFLNYLILSLGFMMFIIPGLILIPALSLYVFDRINLKKYEGVNSLIRCLTLTRIDIKLSFGVIYTLYIGLYIVNLLLNSFTTTSAPNFIVTSTILGSLYSIFSSFSSIIVVMLYNTLLIKTTKNI